MRSWKGVISGSPIASPPASMPHARGLGLSTLAVTTGARALSYSPRATYWCSVGSEPLRFGEHVDDLLELLADWRVQHVVEVLLKHGPTPQDRLVRPTVSAPRISETLKLLRHAKLARKVEHEQQGPLWELTAPVELQRALHALDAFLQATYSQVDRAVASSAHRRSNWLYAYDLGAEQAARKQEAPTADEAVDEGA